MSQRKWLPIDRRYFLGWPCPYKHFHGMTGKTLRYKRGRQLCVECQRLLQRSKRQQVKGNELSDRLISPQ